MNRVLLSGNNGSPLGDIDDDGDYRDEGAPDRAIDDDDDDEEDDGGGDAVEERRVLNALLRAADRLDRLEDEEDDAMAAHDSDADDEAEGGVDEVVGASGAASAASGSGRDGRRRRLLAAVRNFVGFDRELSGALARPLMRPNDDVDDNDDDDEKDDRDEDNKDDDDDDDNGAGGEESALVGNALSAGATENYVANDGRRAMSLDGEQRSGSGSGRASRTRSVGDAADGGAAGGGASNASGNASSSRLSREGSGSGREGARGSGREGASGSNSRESESVERASGSVSGETVTWRRARGRLRQAGINLKRFLRLPKKQIIDQPGAVEKKVLSTLSSSLSLGPQTLRALHSYLNAVFVLNRPPNTFPD